MFFKSNILESIIKPGVRFFKTRVLSGQLHHITQWSSGGDDYCPPLNSEAMCGTINNNLAHGFAFAWKDKTEKIAAPGEKRLYSVDSEGKVAAELHLKNDGTINITGEKIVFNINGAAVVNAQSVELGGEGGSFVLTEKSQIKDGEGRICSITSNTKKTKAV